MKIDSKHMVKTYLTLMLLSTLASSLIWGVNTLFLLDAGLSITLAFAANAFFTLGQVIFEIPTGIIADTWGRRTSYLLGSLTLLVTTVAYWGLWRVHAPFVWWAIVSMLLGLGFTFFSGATEAWLVDGLKATGFTGTLESVFAKGQVISGIAMLVGTVGGGVLAQLTDLGTPYIIRSILLGMTIVVTYILMRDVGFAPRKSKHVTEEMSHIWHESVKHGFGNKPVRYMMLTGPFTMGVGIYGFYALQPYLLQLYGRTDSYAIAGLAAALVGGTQIAGGMLVTHVHSYFKKRTTLLGMALVLSALSLLFIGLLPNFWTVLILVAVWASMFAASMPVRQAYINALIPSEQRATVLSSDNLLSSVGGVVTQPGLGKIAEVNGYATSYVVSGCIQILALPFMLAAKRSASKADSINS